MKKIIFAAAAAGLVTAPVAAQAVPATAPIEGESLGEDGGVSAIVIALAAGVAALLIIAVADDDDEAVSP